MTSMRTLASLIAGGYTAIEANPTVGIVLGLTLYLVWGAPAATKTIFVLDNETGEMKAQPIDKHAEKYLGTRKD